jgi:hypothetical protein
MVPRILLLVAGIAIGVGISMTATRSQRAHQTEVVSNGSPGSNSNRVFPLEAELAEVKREVQRLQQINETLAARVQELLKEKSLSTPSPVSTEPSGLTALFGNQGTNGFSSVIAEMMKNEFEQQIDEKILGIKQSVKLTPEQEAAIRDLLRKKMGPGAEMVEKFLKGEVTQEELNAIDNAEQNEAAKTRALLTPEQAKAYDEFEKEEKNQMARLLASSELLQLQPSLRLTEEQQDKVFAVLYGLAQSDPDAGAAITDNKKAEALRGVLTPEQFERYQKFREQQQKLIDSF